VPFKAILARIASIVAVCFSSETSGQPVFLEQAVLLERV
jgi:hypothetical protein